VSYDLAAADRLATVITSSRISCAKTPVILGRTIDITKPLPELEEEASPVPETPRETRSLRQQANERWTRHREATERLTTQTELLRSQAKMFIGFEQLVEALRALEEWKLVSIAMPP
jgi:hypothetical protein